MAALYLFLTKVIGLEAFEGGGILFTVIVMMSHP